MSLDSNTPRYLYRDTLQSLCPYNCSALLANRGERLRETIIYLHFCGFSDKKLESDQTDITLDFGIVRQH